MKVIHTTIFFLLILSAQSAYADAFVKALLLVNEGSYPEAKAVIEKGLKKDATNAPLHFIAAKYFSSEDNKSFHLDSAYFHASKAHSLFPGTLKEGKLKKLARLGVRNFTINQLLQNICTTAYQKADSINTLEAWEHFIHTYSKARQLSIATERRNHLAYEDAMGSFTYESFKDFMERYPNAEQVTDAHQLYESLLYKKMTESGSWQAYEDFLKKHPGSPYFKEAKEKYELLLFRDFTKDHSLKSYEDFMLKYPENPYTKQAQDSIYAIVTKSRTVFDIQKFIRTYPKNRNIMLAWKELFEVYNVKRDPVILEQFKTYNPDYPYGEQLEREITLARRLVVSFEKNGLYGFRDSASREVLVPPLFDEVYPFSEGLAAVVVGNCEDLCAFGYVDKDGELVIKPQFNEGEDFVNGFAIVGKGDCYNDNCRYGFINRKGEIVVPLEYDEVYEFSEGLALVRKRRLGYGFVDTKGNVRVRLKYTDGGNFSGGLAPVLSDSLWGYIDQSGEWKIPPRFSQAGDFSEGLAPVALSDGLWGYINDSGNFVIEPRFSFAAPFEKNIAKVIVMEKVKGVMMQVEKLIDREGKIIQQN